MAIAEMPKMLTVYDVVEYEGGRWRVTGVTGSDWLNLEPAEAGRSGPLYMVPASECKLVEATTRWPLDMRPEMTERVAAR